MDTLPEYVCSATLMVLGDELNPRRVTELLGLEPSRSWRCGEPKSFARDDGALCQLGGVHEWGGWKCFIPDEQRGAGLAEQLAWWCDALEGREAALGELEAQGCWLRMDCFVGASGPASIELSARLQERLSRLRLNLTVCFSPDAYTAGGEAEQRNAAGGE